MSINSSNTQFKKKVEPIVAEKVILITGTSTGIGRATALHLDKLGFTVFAGVRKEKDAESLRQSASPNLVPIMIDMNDGDSIEKAFEQISKAVETPGLKGLVNNAGVPLGGPLEFFNLDDIRKGLEVNLLGHIHIIQRFLPLIRKGKGRIINIGSIGASISVPLVEYPRHHLMPPTLPQKPLCIPLPTR